MPDPVTPSSQTPPADQPITLNPTPTPADTAAPGPVTVQTAQGSSKSMLWVIIAAFIVVAILVGVGIFMYTQMRETNPAFQQVSEQVQSSLDSAANDLSGVQIDDVSADFSEVDKELNSL